MIGKASLGAQSPRLEAPFTSDEAQPGYHANTFHVIRDAFSRGGLAISVQRRGRRPGRAVWLPEYRVSVAPRRSGCLHLTHPASIAVCRSACPRKGAQENECSDRTKRSYGTPERMAVPPMAAFPVGAV